MPGACGLTRTNKTRAGLASGSIGDEVYTPSPRRQKQRRDQKPSLSEPRRKQNHYAGFMTVSEINKFGVAFSGPSFNCG
jgi:hypothetical protein